MANLSPEVPPAANPIPQPGPVAISPAAIKPIAKQAVIAAPAPVESTPKEVAIVDLPPAETKTEAEPEPELTPEPIKPVTTTAPLPSGTPRPVLSTADIVAQSEASVALIRGKSSVGTGFLIAKGILATNAHVIDGEFIDSIEIRFPSAEGKQKGPFTARMLYKDSQRDLAIFAVKTELPPLEVASAYKFRKGEDVTVIGNPGVGDEMVLENAISRGVVSF